MLGEPPFNKMAANHVGRVTYSCFALGLALGFLFALLENLGRVRVVRQDLGHPDELALLLSRLHGCSSFGFLILAFLCSYRND